MTDALALGEKVLSLLEDAALTTTYKPAVLLALLDGVQEFADDDSIPVQVLAERVIELYWPQTLAYPTTGSMLTQSQAGRRALIVSAVAEYRDQQASSVRALPDALRRDEAWDALVDRVERLLAEWPIPRLQKPYDPFLYTFDWRWSEAGGWSSRAYRGGTRSISLFPGVAEALTSLGPLLRPFIIRWWTDKAARLNPRVEAARSVLEFENFLFGADRLALERVAEGLLDLQRGDCFYCRDRIGRGREVDHFIPWSHSGDNGLDNLVAACRRCNNDKRATLPGPKHLAAVARRNHALARDLAALADERRWPRDHERWLRIARTTYLRSADERPLWIRTTAGQRYESLGTHRQAIAALLG